MTSKGGTAPDSLVQARVRKGVNHGTYAEWEVYDPYDDGLIAVRYSHEEAIALMDGYNLGVRAVLVYP